VVVLADDLMWATRIAEAVRRAGGRGVRLGSEEELAVALEAYRLEDRQTIHGAIVDLAARRFDGVLAIEQVTDAGLPVVAVAEHDDQLTRKRALAAGATRVFSYRKFFEDGTRLVAGWLAAAPQG
jgi:DNA-binding NarL/FixJ family response regulator